MKAGFSRQNLVRAVCQLLDWFTTLAKPLWSSRFRKFSGTADSLHLRSTPGTSAAPKGDGFRIAADKVWPADMLSQFRKSRLGRKWRYALENFCGTKWGGIE